ncbi:MAG TPA: Smr/MutS family protein [Coxiellaceae bacterium]|nr:Smr/MutS family protein [Coxiellaceae bacterium]
MDKPKKPKLSPEESELFRQSLGAIKSLSNDKLHLPIKPKQANVSDKTIRKSEAFYLPASQACSAEEKLYFAKAGLQTKILQQMRRGQIKLEARLDLHRRTRSEAIECIQQFLEQAQARGYKWILIIHGKGQASESGNAVLKGLLNEWLPQQSNVLAFASSQPKHGGTGALYVLLKKV